MTYDYHCQKCGHRFSMNVLMADRDKAKIQKCPECGKPKSIERLFNAIPVTYDISNPVKRAGSEWNDVLKKISQGAGKRSTIDHY